MIRGGCFCGAVRYHLDGALEPGRSCHCSQCRKVFSGAASAYAPLAAGAELVLESGESELRRYLGRDGWGLAFCGVCGSTLFGVFGDACHGLTLGCVDGDPGVVIARHLYVGSKAPWDEIGGDAPRFDQASDADG